MKHLLLNLFWILLTPAYLCAQIEVVDPNPPTHTHDVTPDDQCFTMNVGDPVYDGNGGYCIQITIDIHGKIGDNNAVAIYDDKGHSKSCTQDCSFIWCYTFPTKFIDIKCETTDRADAISSCYKKEGCIVVVGGD